MRIAVVVVLLGCETQFDAPPKPITPEPIDAGPFDATVVVPVPPPLPPTLVGAPRWVMRQLYVGSVAWPAHATTFTLRRDGGRAVLEVATQEGVMDLKNNGNEVASWKPPHSNVTYLGTATDGDTVTIDVSHGADALRLVCKKATQRAGPANARRRPGPRPHRESCGDEGRWVPATTTTVDVLRCEAPDALRKVHGAAPYLAFAASPGIEWTYINEDCVLQGGLWRHLPTDHSIMPYGNY